ncbi:MAG: glycosyltransferase family 39 protein [Crocinitomicaceae bacterium]|nr:glycosyltransferase family 39 protein [Crocinitomicaceae bacterium]
MIFNPTSSNFHFTIKEQTIGLVLFFILWIFLFFKAALMGLFHDELLTFFYYGHSGVILPPEAHWDANNHFLNSYLTHWSIELFGSSPLALRLPNVLAYPFYFFAIFRMAGRFKDSLIRWSFALSLIMCGFIFEYFAMCRGYGLSITFVALAIWAVIRLMETDRLKWLILTAVFLWFAVASNLTALIYAGLILGFLFIRSALVDYKKSIKKFGVYILVILLSGASMLIFVYWSFQLKEVGLLVHGSMLGIYDSTIKTVSEHTFGTFNDLIGVTVVGIFFLAVVVLIARIIKERSLKFVFTFKGLLIYMLIGSATALILMAHILEVNYPEDRTAMYLLIFFFGSFAAILSMGPKWLKYVSCLLLVLPLKFISVPDPAHSQNFDAGRHSDRIFEKVQEMEHDFKFPLTVSVRGFQQMTWYYSNLRTGAKMGIPCHAEFPQLVADIILKEPIDTVPENEMIYTLYDSVYNDPYTGITLFKRKQFLERNLISVTDIQPVENTKAEYYTFLRAEADSLIGKTLYLGVELTLDAETVPFRSRVGLTQDREEEPKNIFYDFIQFDWLKTSYKGEDNNVHYGALIPEVYDEAETIGFYLWNPDTTTFSIRNGKCYLYELKRDF